MGNRMKDIYRKRRVFRRSAPMTLHQIRESELSVLREELNTRTYGFNGTIHHSEQLDVETDHNGEVVAVWFRCMPLPFQQTYCDGRRADSMRDLNREGNLSRLVAVEVIDGNE